jgi:hypothetical protein
MRREHRCAIVANDRQAEGTLGINMRPETLLDFLGGFLLLWSSLRGTGRGLGDHSA